MKRSTLREQLLELLGGRPSASTARKIAKLVQRHERVEAAREANRKRIREQAAEEAKKRGEG